MRYDVFISYSTKNTDEANNVKSILEANGIKCWKAPESIPASSSYMEEIPDGIENSAVFLLLLSEQAQESKWVTKEMGSAIAAGKIIIPFMISKCEITKAFEFSLNDVQRWDAYEDLSGNLEKLVRKIKGIVGIEQEETANSVKEASVKFGAVNAHAWKDIFEYEVSGEAISIIGIKDKTVKKVVIPDEIDGLVVGKIKDSAFRNCEKLTDIRLPDGVTEIEDSAFACCYSLKNIIIPDSVTKIWRNAFGGCYKLKNVTMPGEVYIGSGAFSGTPWLRKQLWKSPWVIKNGCLLDARKTSGFVTIPDGVKVIGGAFAFCSELQGIIIPDGVRKIGDEAFRGCSGLTEIKIPDSVTEIGERAFSDCSSLTEIIIPDSVTEISEWVFYNCTELKEVRIQKNTEVAITAFVGCPKVKIIRL